MREKKEKGKKGSGARKCDVGGRCCREQRRRGRRAHHADTWRGNDSKAQQINDAINVAPLLARALKRNEGGEREKEGEEEEIKINVG